MTPTQDQTDPPPMSLGRLRQLDRMAAECPRCDQWLGQLLMHDIIRKPPKDDR